MPYEITTADGRTGVGEPLWVPGHPPLLMFGEALWTVDEAIRQDLRCVGIAAEMDDQAADAPAHSAWEDAFIDAWIIEGIKSLTPEQAQALDRLGDLAASDDSERGTPQSEGDDA